MAGQWRWVGLDLGTTTVKASLYECNSTLTADENTCAPIQFSVLSTHQENVYTPSIERKFATTGAGQEAPRQEFSVRCHEMDAEMIWCAAQRCLINLLSDGDSKLQALNVAVCGQMHGIILWTKDTGLSRTDEGHTLEGTFSKLFTWQDERCNDEFLDGLPRSEYRPHPGFGCATLTWLQRYHPDVVDMYDYAGTIMDFLIWVLGGSAGKPFMSAQNAFSWGYFDPNTNEWQKGCLSGDFPFRVLPIIKPVGTKVGTTPQPYGVIGVGSSLYIALGDAQCSFAAVNRHPSQAVLNIGTSSQLSFLKAKPATDKGFNGDANHSTRIKLWPYSHDMDLYVCASMNGGNALATFVSSILSMVTSLGINMTEAEIWRKLAEQPLAPTTDDLPVVTPLYVSERHDTEHKGATIERLTNNTMKLSKLYQAHCEGIIENIHRMIPSEVLAQCGISAILCSGGAFMKHPPLYQSAKLKYRNFSTQLMLQSDATLGSVMLSSNPPTCSSNL